jgi:endonuclease YncB( thermonuclease family)
MTRLIAVIVLVLLAVRAAHAAEPRLLDGGSGTVREVIDGRTFVLSDGRVVRLAAVGAPAVPGEGLAFRTSPAFADSAKAALAKLVFGRTVQLRVSGPGVDRYGRVVAQVFDQAFDQERWIQGELVRMGLARVESVVENRGMILAMQKIEDAARAARVGIWSDSRYGVRTPEDTHRTLNRFEIVEGRVLAAEQIDGRIYLNFGPDWRNDFTVSVAPADVRTFRREGIDLLAMAGQRVRVRGWIRSYNGPVIDVTHPEQIQLIGF